MAWWMVQVKQDYRGGENADCMGDSHETHSTTSMFFYLAWGFNYSAKYTWLQKVMKDIGEPCQSPIVLSRDERGALVLLHDTDTTSSHVKHFDNRLHQCREHIELIAVAYENHSS